MILTSLSRFVGAGVLAALCGASIGAHAASAGVNQAARGDCNQNNVVIYQQPGAQSGPPSRTFGTVNTGVACLHYHLPTKSTALERAQLQLLIAEHPTELTVGAASFAIRLGESQTSLWLEVKNGSRYDAREVQVELATEKPRAAGSVRIQSYRTKSLPDTVLSAKSPILQSGASSVFLAASPSELKSLLAEIPADWCLYDIGWRALDWDSDGYDLAHDALMAHFAKSDRAVENLGLRRTVGVIFNVRYRDIFDVGHEFPVQAFLRVASADSKYVFYPSRRMYSTLTCQNLKSS